MITPPPPGQIRTMLTGRLRAKVRHDLVEICARQSITTTENEGRVIQHGEDGCGGRGYISKGRGVEHLANDAILSRGDHAVGQ